MSPRSWMALSALIVAGLLNAVLLSQEHTLPPRPTAVSTVQEAPLRALQYVATRRRRNLLVMGFAPEWAERVGRRIERLAEDAERLQQRLVEGGAASERAFCPGELPQPYAALEVLVADTPAERRNVEIEAPLESRAWFAAADVPALHQRFEEGPRRAHDATVAAVAAVFAGQETSASRRGSFAVPDPDSDRGRAIAEYFARMHVLTELANRPGGICDAG